jgi:hypothetical protein
MRIARVKPGDLVAKQVTPSRRDGMTHSNWYLAIRRSVTPTPGRQNSRFQAKCRLERSRCGGGRIRVSLNQLLWLPG